MEWKINFNKLFHLPGISIKIMDPKRVLEPPERSILSIQIKCLHAKEEVMAAGEFPGGP